MCSGRGNRNAAREHGVAAPRLVPDERCVGVGRRRPGLSPGLLRRLVFSATTLASSAALAALPPRPRLLKPPRLLQPPRLLYACAIS